MFCRIPFRGLRVANRAEEAQLEFAEEDPCTATLMDWCTIVTLWAMLFGASTTHAQIVSPGPLARPHASVEGILNCTRCHTLGQKEIEEAKCFDCHSLIETRVTAGRGYHAEASVRSQGCGECHKDHAGLEFQMIEWEGGREAFDHGLTGYDLVGKHAEVRCEPCHRNELIADPEVLRVLAEHPTKETFLGLARECTSCHFDEHRGQLPQSCETCHDLLAFKPAPLFDHDQSVYPLVGAHRETDCDRCHARVADTPSAGVLQPIASDFTLYNGLAYDDCRDCHEDPHQGRLGERCLNCHLDGTWRVAAGVDGAGRIDHDRTRYPLRGKHIDVACERCHPHDSRGLLVSTGLLFSRCDDCHRDAHQDQFFHNRERDCEACHELVGFTPAKFTEEDHARSRYPLEGAHRAVPCSRCHAAKPDADTSKEAIPPLPEQPPRTRRLATQQISFGEHSLESCETCHGDPHAAQFQTEGISTECTECHTLGSFSELSFDHAAVYPLVDKHAHARCADCHPRDPTLGTARSRILPWLKHVEQATGGAPVRYSGVSQVCRDCHRDPHLGQFEPLPQGDCERCHDIETFDIAGTYDHNTTQFPVGGAHRDLECSLCHPKTEVAPGLAAVRYVAVPRKCEDCHTDPHGGAFRSEYEQDDCAACHNEKSWHQVEFDHALTGFELGVEHRFVACAACHGAEAAPRECVRCHDDVHGTFLGPKCDECHMGVAGFPRVATMRVHERTRLPLVGRHATLPCSACHTDRLDLKFTSLDPQCGRCHEDDYPSAGSLTGMDHLLWGFSRACDQCHDAYRWDRATYLEHEKCFPIARGEHAGITCLRCHTSLEPLTMGTCTTFTADCMQCHECADMSKEHREIEGFECADRKCWECHPQGRR